MAAKLTRLFVYTAGTLLLALGLAIFIGWSDETGLVLPHDPLFVVPMAVVFWAVAAVSLGTGLFCLLGRSIWWKLCLVLWSAIEFEAYQLGLTFFVGPRSFQGYWGSLTGAFDLPSSAAYWLSTVAAFYLISGSLVSLVALWLDDRKVRITGSCVACGEHIAFLPKDFGRQIACPHCHALTVLADKLKMTCVLCGGHIEFPSHAVGQKLACPHCGRRIKLLTALSHEAA
jgi:DNA-directed RNA polymerase subunit RPC12/RpoP